jgi:hypothetical protein
MLNRPLCAHTGRAVIVLGWLALFATSSPPRPAWFVTSESIERALSVPPFGEETLTFVVRVEGLEALVENPPSLRIDGPDGPFSNPEHEVDASVDEALPIVVGNGRTIEASYRTRIDVDYESGDADFAFFAHPSGCADITPCARTFTVHVRAGASGIDGVYTFTGMTYARVDAFDTVEPPPGRVTLELREAP